MKKRLFSLLLAGMLALALLPSAALATGPSGNYADDIVSVACAQEGRDGPSFGWNAPWCAYFTCWAGNACGADFPSPVTSYGTPRHITKWFTNNNKGTFYWLREATYQSLVDNGLSRPENAVRVDASFRPQKGDLIIFRWNNADASVNWSHIGIVRENYSGSGRIKTVEGNCDSKVCVTSRAYNAEIAGFVRPFESGGGSVQPPSTPNVYFSLPTDPTYTAKQWATETNAGICNKINKDSGVSVTNMGVYLYDSAGGLIKRHIETTNNVPPSQTAYHTWFDINAELGVTLSRGATYYYEIFGIFNGVEVKGSRFSFTTAGEPEPPPAPSVSFALPTEAAYTAKQWVTETNAGICNQVDKAGGVSTTNSGVYLYDVNGSLIKRHVEDTTNVSDSLTHYHIWYDINRELGLTLSPGTTYYYEIFGVFNGVELKGPRFEFTTKPAPRPQVWNLFFEAPGAQCSEWERTVIQGQPYGELPVPVREGYDFEGWYTAETGGRKVSGTDIVDLDRDATLYARWTRREIAVGFRQLDNPGTDGLVLVYSESSALRVEVTKPAGSKLSEVVFTVYDPRGGELYTKTGGGVANDSHTAIEYSFTVGSELFGKLERGEVYSYGVKVTVDGGRYESPRWRCRRPEGSSATMKFSDVNDYDYFFEPVRWAIERGITTGSTDTTFSPFEDCQRCQIITFLWRAKGCPAPSIDYNPFLDVKSDTYFYDACRWAYEQGVTPGGLFLPYANCTRASAVEFMWKAEGSPTGYSRAKFSDVLSFAPYARAVDWALANGVTTGTTDTTFSPDNTCTRGQIVTFLYRYMAK